MASKNTIKVTFNEKNSTFSVEDLNTGIVKQMPIRHFYGVLFKYDTDFKSAFLKAFDGKTAVIYSDEAKKKIEEIRDFNRIDC